jgi:peptidoglycan hydrolase-like protein with peptidoglycan-binding domain
MTVDTRAVQIFLKEKGYPVGPIDGIDGRNTQAAITAFGLDEIRKALAMSALISPPPGVVPSPSMRGPVVPADWMPPAIMKRVHVHWTAGKSKASDNDREHYHILIEGDGTLVRGKPSIALNQAPLKAGYAAHTLNANSGAIGVSLCGMIGAQESPFDSGSAPITPAQWAQLALVCADLCERYGIPVTPQTVLSHAEVQGTLGISQRGKWDIARLPWNPNLVGATAVGNDLRAAVSAAL